MRRQRGFTLLELSVATAISGIVTVGVLALLRGQISGYDRQQRVQDAQTSVRGAMDQLMRAVVPAGFGIPGEYLLGSATANNRPSIGPAPEYICPGTDVIEIRSREPVGFFKAASATSTSISVREPLTGEADIVPITSHMKIVNGQLFFVFASAGRYGLVSTTTNLAAMTATATLALTSNSESANLATFAMSVGDMVPVRSTRFFVSCNPATNAKPYLFMAEGFDSDSDGVVEINPVAENIEDLQFAYLLDADADGILNASELAAPVHAPTAAQYPTVKAIRITLVGRSSQQLYNEAGGSVTVSQQPILEDHDPGRPADRYSRRILQQTILLENRNTTQPTNYNHFSSRYL